MKTKFQIKETIVTIIAEDKFIDVAKQAIMQNRRDLEGFIAKDPFFRLTLEPYPPDKNAPEIVKRMIDSSSKVKIGPMSSVAGTISQLAVEAMIDSGATHAIVDNGGDIAMINNKPVIVGVYAGNIKDFALEIEPRDSILGICTSSGKVGPSISFGQSDSVTVVSENTSLADAAATAIGNRVVDENSIKSAIDDFKSVDGLDGVLVICGSNIGTWGKLPKIVKADVSYDLITKA